MNSQDVAMWALMQGATCPALVDIQSALAASASSKYPKNGDVIYPGVTLVDVQNGLVHVDVADVKAPGWRFSAFPVKDSLDPAGQGSATVDWNTGIERLVDLGDGLIWRGVEAMRRQDSAASPWVLDEGKWLAKASPVGSEYQTWDAVIDYIVNKWLPPRQ
jgi:hypothetical protein